MQDALQALGFSGEQGSERVRLQGNALHFLGAERPLGNHCLGLTLQSDYRLIDSVDSGAAGSIHYCQALLYIDTTHTIIIYRQNVPVTFNYLEFEVFTVSDFLVEIQLDPSKVSS